VDDLNPDLIAHEEWRVENGRLAATSLLRRPEPIKPGETLTLPRLEESLPSDVRGIVEEFESSFRDLLRWATVYSADELRPLGLLLKEVQTLIVELLWLRAGERADPPKGLREYDLAGSLVRSRLVQQRTDRIVQINAALSYVISQSCFGTPPVLVESCLIRRHSLFGIGRAHRALLNLVREVERAFNAQSVPGSIYKKWHEYPRLEGFESAKQCDTSKWGALNLPDVLISGQADPQPLKLVYFSGRLGFRESEYAISAAIHTLTSGDAPEWHLSTMTHEILHGHVRDIIGAIFDRVRLDDPKKTEKFWNEIFLRFRKHMLSGLEDCRLIDSARSVFLSYCCMVTEMGSLTQLPVKPTETTRGKEFGAIKVPVDPAVLRRRLEEEDRSISEIIVHTLDSFYFYDDNFESYSRAVWSSWRTVPVVLRDVRQYVLRMLLAGTSIDAGDEIGRFARSRNRLRQSMSQLNVELGGDAVLERAIELLNRANDPGVTERTAEANHPLFQPFYAALRIVDFARSCLASGIVKGALFNEDFLKVFSESDLDFGFTPGEFSDRRVRSVAEFTAWRARSRENGGFDEGAAERRTAWLFLALGRLSETGRRGSALEVSNVN
jgi:hypothetical protein